MELHNYKRRVAFTLAETLITLGIIGVVAAVVMPTLINKIQDRQNIAKWKREYSLISNAFQKVYNDGTQICSSYTIYGSCESSVSGSMSDEFREKIIEQLKVVDYCTGSNTAKACDYYNRAHQEYSKYKWSGVANIYSRYKALGSTIDRPNDYTQHGIHAYNFYNYAYLLNDGAAVYFGGSHGGPWIVVDVNNFTQGPNEFGRDVFVIKIVSNNITNQHWAKPMGAEGTFNKAANGEVCECSKDKGVKTANYIAGGGGTGEVISGACCSAYYLYSK